MGRWRRAGWLRDMTVMVVCVCLAVLPWLTIPLSVYADEMVQEADKGRRTGANLLLNFATPNVVNDPPMGPLGGNTVNMQELFPGYNDPSQHDGLVGMGSDPATLSTQGIATRMALESGSDITSEGYQTLIEGTVNPHAALMNPGAELLMDRTRPLLAGTDPLLDEILTGCVADVTPGAPAGDTVTRLEDIWTCTQARTDLMGTCRVERNYTLNPVETRRVLEIQGKGGGGDEHWMDFYPAPIPGLIGMCQARRQGWTTWELDVMYPPGPVFVTEYALDFWTGEPQPDIEYMWVAKYCGTHAGRTAADILEACTASANHIEGRCRNTVANTPPLPINDGDIISFWVPGPGSGNCSPWTEPAPYTYAGCPDGRAETCQAARNAHYNACMGSAATLTGTENITGPGLGSGTAVTVPDQTLFGVTVDVIHNGFNPGAHGLMAGDYVIANHTPGGTGIVSWSLGDGGSYGSNWDYTFTVTLDESDEFFIDATLYEIVDNGFVFDGCSEADMRLIRDGECSGSVSCVDYSPCRTVDGVELCEPPHPSEGITQTLASWNGFTTGIQPMCWEVEAVFNDCILERECIGTDTCDPSCEHLPPELQAECLAPPCWVDWEGNLQCLDSTVEQWNNNLGDPGWVDNCEELLVDPDCTLQPQMSCIEGMEDEVNPWDINACLARSRYFDCGHSVTVPGIPGADDVDVTCGAVMRCLGDECANADVENNTDFIRAATAATTISESASDTECSIAGNPESCRMFVGTRERCKDPRGWTLGIIPECCKEGRKAGRNATDFVTYMQLARHSMKLARDPHVAAYLSQTAVGSGIQTIVNTPTEWGRSAGRAITNGFNSAKQWMGFNPSSGASAADALTSQTALSPTAFGPIQQYIAQGVYDFLGSIGQGAFADSLFAVTGEGIVTEWAASGLGQMIGTAISVIGLIYTTYKVLQILGSIFFPCEEEEMAFGIQQANRSCHYVGKYCSKRVRIGFIRKCVIDTETYCCFSSPFARILNQQLRLQGIGADWGTARQPNCEGVSIAQLNSVNWDLVDLSEWEAIMFEAGLVPDPRNPAHNFVPTHRHPGDSLGGSEGTPATELSRQQVEIAMPYFDTHRPDLETAPLFQPDPELLPWFDDGGG